LSARNRRVRIYTITAKGRKQLEEQCTSYERMLLGIGMVMKAAKQGAD
jgi:DNA-binding PadR family transcriptional regulator